VVVLEIALRNSLLVDQIERNAELIEGVAIPPEFLRAAPIGVDRDARNVGVVRSGNGQCRKGNGSQAQTLRRTSRARDLGGRSSADERAGRPSDGAARSQCVLY